MQSSLKWTEFSVYSLPISKKLCGWQKTNALKIVQRQNIFVGPHSQVNKQKFKCKCQLVTSFPRKPFFFVRCEFFLKKWANPGLFSFIFILSKKHYNSYNKQMRKTSIQYPGLGFKLTTFCYEAPPLTTRPGLPPKM